MCLTRASGDNALVSTAATAATAATTASTLHSRKETLYVNDLAHVTTLHDLTPCKTLQDLAYLMPTDKKSLLLG